MPRRSAGAGPRRRALAAPDMRLCFVGDSFVAGVGDQTHVGWAGHLASRATAEGVDVTPYNLGVRGETSVQVGRRWLSEAEARLPSPGARAAQPGSFGAVVASFGVNDTALAVDDAVPAGDGGAGAGVQGVRVESGQSEAALAGLLDACAERGWAAFVVGPPPVADEEHNRRIRELSARFRAVCRERGVKYADVFGRLVQDPVWTAEVGGGDGAHPDADGYERMADVLAMPWARWLHATVRLTP